MIQLVSNESKPSNPRVRGAGADGGVQQGPRLRPLSEADRNYESNRIRSNLCSCTMRALIRCYLLAGADGGVRQGLHLRPLLKAARDLQARHRLAHGPRVRQVPASSCYCYYHYYNNNYIILYYLIL